MRAITSLTIQKSVKHNTVILFSEYNGNPNDYGTAAFPSVAAAKESALTVHPNFPLKVDKIKLIVFGKTKVEKFLDVQ
jgi:hypothetical protein